MILKAFHDLRGKAKINKSYGYKRTVVVFLRHSNCSQDLGKHLLNGYLWFLSVHMNVIHDDKFSK